MLGALAVAIAKDLRLLARDRAGLLFLTLAPLVVITVAGLSLASLYGADPRGTSAYRLPVADEDGGAIGRRLARRLAREPSVSLESVANAAAARDLVRRQEAGAALVIPPGTSAAVAAGHRARLALYTDPVKYLEVARVRAIVQELRHGIERIAHDRAARRLARARADLGAASARLEKELAGVETAAASARADLERRLSAARGEAASEVHAAATRRQAAVRARLLAALAPLRTFFTALAESRQAFQKWMEEVRAKAGRFADRFPPPPDPPVVPSEVAALAEADDRTLATRLLGDDAMPEPGLPRPPRLPPTRIELPALPAIPEMHLPGTLHIREASVTGAPNRLNTFDQNVPGFSVTFLLLGMLLGVSLGLLDERDWGTLDRLRTMPAPFSAVLVAKLVARLTVGVAQMIALFAVGRLAFGVSLGPTPWALLLPTAGIVFAATAFGLVVAGVAPSREAVLPVGSVVVVTMAAVGGCWWPIDLEPPWMREAALALPTTWAMRAFNDLMIRRHGVEAALLPTAVLLAHGIAYLAVGLFLFRRRTTRG